MFSCATDEDGNDDKSISFDNLNIESSLVASPIIIEYDILLSRLFEKELVNKDFIGFNCRTYALESVLRWLFDNKKIPNPPPPARKKDVTPHAASSLRSALKSRYHSAVGEVYNIETLAHLAEEIENVEAISISTNNFDEYLTQIVAALCEGIPPIIFFDMDLTSSPAKLKGQYEHAAVIVGYTEHDGEAYFKVAQFGSYFDFKAKDIYESSAQLLQKREESEIYCKIVSKFKFFGRTGWVSQDHLEKHRLTPITTPRPSSSPTTNGGFAGKILLVKSKGLEASLTMR